MADAGELSGNGQKIADREWRAAPPGGADAFPISAKEFEEQFDEQIGQTLDINTWRLGNDLNQEYRRIEHEVRQAEEFETSKEKEIRAKLFPRLAAVENMPRNAGK